MLSLKVGCVNLKFWIKGTTNILVNNFLEFVEKGCNFVGVRIRALLYTDKIVLVATSSFILRFMISKL